MIFYWNYINSKYAHEYIHEIFISILFVMKHTKTKSLRSIIIFNKLIPIILLRNSTHKACFIYNELGCLLSYLHFFQSKYVLFLVTKLIVFMLAIGVVVMHCQLQKQLGRSIRVFNTNAALQMYAAHALINWHGFWSKLLSLCMDLSANSQKIGNRENLRTSRKGFLCWLRGDIELRRKEALLDRQISVCCLQLL